jgi:uncharacterized protein YndB with AHSA1/START domain
MERAMSSPSLDVIRTSITVPLSVERTFELFVQEFGRWWPLAYTYSLDRFKAAEIEPRKGGRWFERDSDGNETSWGDIRAYEPPKRIVAGFAVSPMRVPEPPEKASEVEFHFRPEGSLRTCLEVEHRDFSRHGEGGAQLRAGMASQQGWPLILACFAREAAR